MYMMSIVLHVRDLDIQGINKAWPFLSLFWRETELCASFSGLSLSFPFNTLFSD